jgi:hypothetical protein
VSTFPLLKGVKLRATKINSCGLPIAGPANRLVTDGFVSVNMAQEMKDANEIEQLNAEGKVCVADRTPPQRKRYNVDLELCQVNTGLISMFSGWEQVLNWDDEPVGFRDQKDVDADYGVAIEVWTGGRADEECPVQDTDDIFQNPGSGKSYGYLLFGGVEWRISSDINITADVTTITVSGITIAMGQWGRGPYNVVATDASNTPGRLLDPLNADQHLYLERTPIAPPTSTPGDEPVALAVSSIFQNPDYYFGGPVGAPAAAVAPEQPAGS